MAEINTDSYPRPQLPVNTLDVAGKLGGLQQQKLQIDQAKLDQANQGLNYLSRGITAIGPNGTPDQYLAAGQNVVKLLGLPPQMLDTLSEKLQTYNSPNGFDSNKFYNDILTQRATHQEMINTHLGQQGLTDTGQSLLPTRTPQGAGGTIQTTGAPIQKQIPPTAEVRDSTGQPAFLGAQAPDIAPGSGAVSAPPPVNSLPVSQPRPVAPIPAGHSNNFGGSILSVQPPPDVSFTQPAANKDQGRMVPRGPATGFPPGVAEGEQASGLASGQHLAEERTNASNYQRDVFPLMQAIPALERLGTKGTGPGTETINHLKSFVLSTVPGVKESDFKGTVEDFDIANKYLKQFVNTSSLPTKSVDGLASAFAGNPSVGISNAAAVDVAKSALALRNMKQAQYLEFETKKLPASVFSKWAAQRNNELDPRAFGINMINDEAKAKLKAQLNKNPAEKRKFEQSLELAHSFGLITPTPTASNQ